MTTPLQTALPYDALTPRSLPGIAPLDPADWLIVDEAYAGQMAQRDALITTQRPLVIDLEAQAQAAAQELLEMAVNALLHRPQRDFVRDGNVIIRPDGASVALDDTDPLATLGRLAQEDFCILQKHGSEHVLTGAVLCFPASWLLSEKLGKPLIGIHIPVDRYTGDIAKRVQRLFDGVRADRPLWRFNALWYADAELHQPRSANERRPPADRNSAPYFRSEKQSILRLPKTDAVVFSIHTFVLARKDVRL
ncbi:heme-dependent oxidative N-demethylase family protein [Shimia sediminis]|uniref:heme-dependent oxidative N-demethylase family protein n=1 Tax=Shimia sediminis TaxID=2497945 RepID=UPI000F8E0A4B|nr:DUF3445 domain-containing protein [Shimia sediminis]